MLGKDSEISSNHFFLSVNSHSWVRSQAKEGKAKYSHRIGRVANEAAVCRTEPSRQLELQVRIVNRGYIETVITLITIFVNKCAALRMLTAIVSSLIN